VEYPESSSLVSRLEVVPEAGSTNDELVRRAGGPDSDGWPDFSVLLTDHQTAGRGRMGREWVSRPGASLIVSVLLRPGSGRDGVPLERYSWFPLVAGLAMARAIDGLVDGDVSVKWPNDVLIDGLKVCGVLAELLQDGRGIVIGSGVNLGLDADELPVPTATSLKTAGARDFASDTVLARYLGELRELYTDLSGPGDEPLRRVREAVSARCGSLGREVRVELPSGSVLTGTATGIDETGRLILRGNDGTSVVAAGDVTHLRY